MIRKSLVLVLLIAASLSGCASGSLQLSTPGAVVGVSTGGGGGAVHCPPGQAKKGNC